MNLNKVFIIGRLTADPLLKTIPSGQSVCSFSLATNRTWTGKDGAKQEESQFHNCVAWGKTAELITQYMKKGNELFVEGRIQTRSWDDKNTGSKRYATEIVVENMQFGARPQGGGQRGGGKASEQQSTKEEEIPTIDLEAGEAKIEDLPF